MKPCVHYFSSNLEKEEKEGERNERRICPRVLVQLIPLPQLVIEGGGETQAVLSFFYVVTCVSFPPEENAN